MKTALHTPEASSVPDVGELAPITALLAAGLVPTPPAQHAPMPEQSLAPAGWLTRLARFFVPDEVDASLESPP